VVGSEISHYRIDALIGRGGMGEVYLARDLTLGRKVALKFLPGEPDDASGRDRLVREAQSAARLDHPFICKIYEVAESGGRAFIAMEYVEGTTLRDRLLAARLPVALAIRMGCEIAEALDLAHRRGVVHRDLKPANVMVPPDGHVKVMDFGLALQVPTGDVGSVATMMAAGSDGLTGTLAYMSPEQLLGLPIDARSDIFAFGLLLHEMATGAHPFRRASIVSMTDAILHEAEPPVEVPGAPALGHIISRCLAKNREDRYQSIRDVGFELRALIEDSASTKRLLPPRSPRRPLRMAAVAAAVFVAAAAFALWRLIPLPLSQQALAFKERDWILVADFENLTGDTVFDRSLRTATEVGISQSKFVNVLPESRVQDVLRRMQKAGVQRLDESLAIEVAVREGVRSVLAGTITQVGGMYSLTARVMDPRSGVAVWTAAVQVKGKDQVLGGLDALASRVRRGLGESLRAITTQAVPLPKGTTASLDALKMYADSLHGGRNPQDREDLLVQALALDPDFALAHAELGYRYYLGSEASTRAAGEEQFQKALALLDRLTVRERMWIRASAEDSRGNRRAAADAYRSYLAEYPDDSRAWFRMGWTEMAGLGEIGPAIDAFKHSLALNPADASAYINLATCLAGTGRYREAVEQYDKGFALDPALMTADFVNNEYGFTLVRLGEIDKAAGVFNGMIATDRRARGLRSMAVLEMYRGRYDAALPRLREAILLNRTSGSTVSEYRDRLFLVRALDARGLRDAAGAELDAADRLAAKTALSPEWLSLLAKIRARGGQSANARRLLDRMSKTAADVTTGSSANRATEREALYFDLVQGEIALAERLPVEAVSHFEAALAVDPRSMTAIESLAAALAAAGRPEDAAGRYEELLAAQPLGIEAQEDWLGAHVRVGELYEKLGRPADARQRYQRLLAIWTDADTDLPLKKEAARRLARLVTSP
jgi:eukaryotic-like serine/threonine-protein kinase